MTPECLKEIRDWAAKDSRYPVQELLAELDRLRSKLGAAEMIIEDLTHITIPKLEAKLALVESNLRHG